MFFLQPTVLSEVCCHLPKTDLKAVALCSSLCRVSAQRVLYQDITVDDSTLPVLEALAAMPHLANYVRTFGVTITPSSCPPSVYQAVARAISQMGDLLSLSLSIPGPQASTALPPHSYFPKMRNLKATFAIDSNMAQFLQTAPQLITLHLYDLPGLTLDDSLARPLPFLLRYRNSLTVGRLASSTFFTARDLTPQDIRSVAQASPSIRVTILDARISSPLLPLLQAICSELPELERLRLSTTYEFWDNVSLATRNLEAIQHILNGAAFLHSAEICRALWKRCADTNGMVSNLTFPDAWLPTVDDNPDKLDDEVSGFSPGCTDWHLYSDIYNMTFV